MNLFMKQTHRHRKQTQVTKGKGSGGGKNEKFGTRRYKQLYTKHKQDPIVQNRELYSTSCNKDKINIMEKSMYVCITESLCCTSEIKATL